MNKSLSVYQEQAIQEIQERLRKAIDYGNRVIRFGSLDAIDEAIAARELDRAVLSFVVLLEQYPDTHRTLLKEAKKILTSSRKEPLEVQVVEGEAYLVWPFKLSDLVEMFRSIHIHRKETESDRDIDSLLEILNRSEYYITQTEVFRDVPRSEKDVHVRIEGLLRCFYGDLQTKPRISKTIKSFEPDTEIPSLKALIEYKYITNRSQGRIIIDQVLADMAGYQSPDRDNIIFVIYETGRVFSKADWDRMIDSCKPRNRIECVVIKGVSYARKATS